MSLIELFFCTLFPTWTFSYRNLVYINYIIQVVSFFGIIVCLLRLVIKDNIIQGILYFFIIIIGFIACFLSIHPIDTYSDPIDIECIKIENNGIKTIKIQKISGKTNNIRFDTITVKDILIFRKIYKK